MTLQSQNRKMTSALDVFKKGGDDPNDSLLSPGSVLLGARVCDKNSALAQGFISWMVDHNGGQAVVRGFQKPGSSEFVYSEAPDCKVEAVKCAGW